MPDSSIPPHQTGAPLRAAVGLDGEGRGVPAHPAHLDVDDAAGAEGEGVARVVGAVDALVEADRGLDLLLQVHVVHDVVPAQGLLDHHEAVGVELAEERRVLEGVGAVGVDHERQRRESGPGSLATSSLSLPGLILILMRR